MRLHDVAQIFASSMMDRPVDSDQLQLVSANPVSKPV